MTGLRLTQIRGEIRAKDNATMSEKLSQMACLVMRLGPPVEKIITMPSTESTVALPIMVKSIFLNIPLVVRQDE
jgi:hypothetical protein